VSVIAVVGKARERDPAVDRPLAPSRDLPSGHGRWCTWAALAASRLSRANSPAFPSARLCAVRLRGTQAPHLPHQYYGHAHAQSSGGPARASLLVTQPEFSKRPDPLGEALILLARRLASIEAQEAAMTAVDQLGFHLRWRTQEGLRAIRIAFPREVNNPNDTRSVVVGMGQQARQR
jgi:Protein of unknown function (DUF2470)